MGQSKSYLFVVRSGADRGGCCWDYAGHFSLACINKAFNVLQQTVKMWFGVKNRPPLIFVKDERPRELLSFLVFNSREWNTKYKEEHFTVVQFHVLFHSLRKEEPEEEQEDAKYLLAAHYLAGKFIFGWPASCERLKNLGWSAAYNFWAA